MTRWIGGGKSITGGPSGKHVAAILRHSTLPKACNLAMCELERLTGRIKVSARPYVLKLELANACNLKCPGCPTGLRIPGREQRAIDPDVVRELMKEIGPYLYIAHLYNWGEPMLHPKASEIVEIVSRSNVYTSMSSHLSLRNFDRIETVCRAGLSHLTVSIDGITQVSYRRYRRGGNLDLVLSNLERLVGLRRKQAIRTTIEWQMISFRETEGEIEAAHELSQKIGVDWFRTRAPIAPDAEQPTDPRRKGRHHGYGSPCGMPWRYLAVQSDGAVSACCNTYFPEDDFGHLQSGPIEKLRNNRRFEQARRLATLKGWQTSQIDSGHPCLRCPVLHGSPMAADIRKSFPDLDYDSGFMAVQDNQKVRPQPTDWG